MNTKEIDQFVRGDRASRGIFQGVFSADTLPDKPRLLVCNTDPSSKPGSHWIVIFIDLKGAENISIRSGANRQRYLKTI
jgi:hypothetical protein